MRPGGRVSDTNRPVATSTDLVLLLPGWGTPPARMEPLSHTLSGAGAIPRVWSYTPEGAFDELVSQVSDVARSFANLHEPDDRLHLVGHSLGGLAVSAAALRDLDGRVTTVTTINSPWRGTWVSYTGSGPLARALRWGSPDLGTLRDELTRHLEERDGPRWLLVSAAGDLATPATTALGVPLGSSGRMQRRLVRSAGHTTSLSTERLLHVVVDHVVGTDTASSATWDEQTRNSAS